MQTSEIEELISELETRVDRLRALYEQYFMGIEKMEPHVAKKDVERRVQTIRREQIRNTAVRFRFHMVLQRYNTYQTYWIRVCREIEEGTYKRDVLRAKAKFGEVRELPKWHRKRYWKKEGAEAKTDDASVAKPAEEAFDDIDMEESFEDAEAPTRQLPSKAPPVPSRSLPPKLPAAAFARSTPPGAEKVLVGPNPAPTTASGKGLPQDPTKDERMRELARRLSVSKDSKEGLARPMTPQAMPSMRAGSSPDLAPSSDRKPPAQADRPAAPAPAPAPSANGKTKPEAEAGQARAARDLSEERMKQLYSELVETKRKQKESTVAVTYEGLVKTLKESSAKLKEKHGGRSVDFEVTVKDGKTILRPVVK